MSRIGNKAIVLPSAASVELVDNTIVVKGPKGQLSFEIPSCVSIHIDGANITFTGYRAQLQGKKLVVNAGYSHPVEMEIPEGLTVTVPNPTEIHVVGCNKELVGQFAAEVRIIRKPEPYKGKGIHYRGEYIRRKEGKKAK